MNEMQLSSDGLGEQFEAVYRKLRTLAERHFRTRSPSMTLQPTALVHEVYVRMARSESVAFKDREHFLAIAATAMRQIVIDRARRRVAAKRGGECILVGLGDDVSTPDQAARDTCMNLLDVDALLRRLARLSQRQARIVELRIFAGMTVAEIARALRVSQTTIEKDWRLARAWMRVELQRGHAA